MIAGTPDLAAVIRIVSPFGPIPEASAPAATNASTSAVLPFRVARYKGVTPKLVAAIDAAPAADDAAQDARDAARFYELLEREVVPEFHRRDERGIPVDWVRRMKRSLRTIGPRFCATRMVGEYVKRIYPAG